MILTEISRIFKGKPADGMDMGKHATSLGQSNVAFAPTPLFVAKGFGGRIELYPKEIRIIKSTWVNHVLHFMAEGAPPLEHIIPLKHLSGIMIMKPMFLNDYIFFSYPGSPYTNGHQLHDATLENALMMNFFDNRRFFELKDHVHAALEALQSPLV